MISVLCKSDTHLHLAPRGVHGGTDSFTLCLKKWTKREPCREGDLFCTECLIKFKQQTEETQHDK